MQSLFALRKFFAYGIAAMAIVLAGGTAQAQTAQVIVNGVPISPQQVLGLETTYGMPIAPGAYWYDPISGLWGPQGGPSVGQILPGLNLGGPLQADASSAAGHTGVFFNGREIHPLEYVSLQQRFGYVIPGRYWLSPQGIGGPEGGPATFNIGNVATGASGSGGSTSPDDVNAPCVYVDNPDGSYIAMPGC